MPASISDRPAARSIVSWSALANTSTGAPWAICCSSAPDAAKLKRTVAPGVAASKPVPMSLKALVRLAAAETVICWANATGGQRERERGAGKREGNAGR